MYHMILFRPRYSSWGSYTPSPISNMLWEIVAWHEALYPCLRAGHPDISIRKVISPVLAIFPVTLLKHHHVIVADE